jgi:hypothetical protein
MKQKILLTLFIATSLNFVHAQQKKAVTGYAITAQEMGGRSWKEVRLVDVNSGESLKTIYLHTDESQNLNARTGKPVMTKEVASANAPGNGKVTIRKIVNLDEALAEPSTSKVRVYNVTADRTPLTGTNNTNVNPNINTTINTNINTNVNARTVYIVRTDMQRESGDKPFATNSAACAYDKKHERLYYTPMGINQLRYIDLKSSTPKIYYFEDEKFGTVAGSFDAANQITRMVIASDGNGYALSNDGNHLIQFTTGKKPTITDMGALNDDAKNGNASVHSGGMYGGDMIADASRNLYLVSANRSVYKISIETKTATFLGTIKGLPRGFSTNGAMVESGSKVIIASSESTVGYYRFDLETLQAEKVSSSDKVFNASDLANGNLAFSKKKKDTAEEEPAMEELKAVDVVATEQQLPPAPNSILAYPNPVTNGQVKLSFADQPAGKYQVQLVDLSGRLVYAKAVNVNGKNQVVELHLPEMAKGSYLLKINSEENKVNVTNKLIVQ